MDQSLSSLTFKGSIAEAIAEAKQQKKLFVVYTSGKCLLYGLDFSVFNQVPHTQLLNNSLCISVNYFFFLNHLGATSVQRASAFF